MKGFCKRSLAIVLAVSMGLIMPLSTGCGKKTDVKQNETEDVKVDQITMDMTGLSEFSLGDVILTDETFVNAYEKEVDYLTSFDTDRFLAGFRETAGLDMKGKTRYPGWESSLIGGHTIGHYMAACVNAYESANAGTEDRASLLTIITDLTNGLKECQDAVGTGFIFGATIIDKNNIEKQFDNVESNKTNISTEAWVPWYTMHKIFEGILAVANMSPADGDDAEVTVLKATAKETASKLADWVYNRASGWSTQKRATVLSIEYGGMNDVLYDTYLLTGNENHLTAAHIFDQDTLFEKVLNAKAGDNVLNDLHANTTIPKFMGALKRYVVTGEQQYLDYVCAFWNLVINDHTYITGGNSEWEHFGKDDILDGERTNCNNETCNVYNMLKMTKLLFEITGECKYMDYYENGLLNTIMSSQNPETGMTTYFQPMASGYFKVYGEAFTKFWCCTGTGMENFSKLAESFYFVKDDTLLVEEYISSKVVTDKISLTQETSIPESDTATFTFDKDYSGKIALRLPDWLAAAATIEQDGKKVSYSIANASDDGKGYAVLEGSFKAGTKITVTLPMQVAAYNLPDGENTYAFKYGPVVLSALLGSESMDTTTTGVIVTIPAAKLISSAYTADGGEKITVYADSVADFMANINDNLVRDESASGLTFKLQNCDANLTYVTHYSQYKERYGIYFRFTADAGAADSAQIIADKKSGRLEEMKLDTVQPGYGQYENDTLHNMTEAGNGSTGSTDSGTSRYANAGGSFTYNMVVDPAGTDLIVFFDNADAGKTLKITSGDTVIFDGTIETGSGSELTEKVMSIPAEALTAAVAADKDGENVKVIPITFAGTDTEASAKLCSFIYTVKTLGTDTEITSVKADNGSVFYNADLQKYVLAMTEETDTVSLSLTLPDEFAYVAVDGDVVDEDKVVLAANKGGYAGYTLTVTAENHADTATYSLLVISPSVSGTYAEAFKDAAKQDTVTVTETYASDTKLYFVDCGDHDTSTVSDGDSFGALNSVTEQLAAADASTGFIWGVVDSAEDQYNGSSKSNGLYTANTWCYEYNGCKDGLDKLKTNRYTKNQYESGIDRHLDYTFELPDGKYIVKTYFSNPWSCSTKPCIYAYYGTDKEVAIGKNLNTDDEMERRVTVSGGKLDLHFTSEDKCINLCYIEIVTNEDIESSTVYTKVK